jgi:hypothetical protein
VLSRSFTLVPLPPPRTATSDPFQHDDPPPRRLLSLSLSLSLSLFKFCPAQTQCTSTRTPPNPPFQRLRLKPLTSKGGQGRVHDAQCQSWSVSCKEAQSGSMHRVLKTKARPRCPTSRSLRVMLGGMHTWYRIISDRCWSRPRPPHADVRVSRSESKGGGIQVSVSSSKVRSRWFYLAYLSITPGLVLLIEHPPI